MTLEEFAGIRSSEAEGRGHICPGRPFSLPYTTGFLLWVYGTLVTSVQRPERSPGRNKGTYFVRTFYQDRSRQYETGIKDPVSGKGCAYRTQACRIEGQEGGCSRAKPAQGWYAAVRGGGKKKKRGVSTGSGRPPLRLHRGRSEDISGSTKCHRYAREKSTGPYLSEAFFCLHGVGYAFGFSTVISQSHAGAFCKSKSRVQGGPLGNCDMEIPP
jgi:hypothetical protein